MYKYYSKEEIEILREGGKRLSKIINELGDFLKIGLKVLEIEKKSLELIEKYDAIPATVNYTPQGASFPFPSSVCTSINNGIAHGISKNNQRVLKNGDIVSLDIVIKYKGLFVDVCRTFPVGKMQKKDLELISAAREVTNKSIEKAVIKSSTEEIGAAAEETAKIFGFDTVKELGGHGVGRAIHSKPFIPNGAGLGVPLVKIKEGMVLAIEPIIAEGKTRIADGEDGYLYETIDGKNSAQFEETILVTKNGPEILTSDEFYKK
jgi:methionyl aminopeptidase